MEFLRDLKTVYGAVSKETAETQLDALAGKWGEMYPIVIKSWRDNWKRLTEYFQYTPAIRRYCPKKCVTIISHIFHFIQNYLPLSSISIDRLSFDM